MAAPAIVPKMTMNTLFMVADRSAPAKRQTLSYAYLAFAMSRLLKFGSGREPPMARCLEPDASVARIGELAALRAAENRRFAAPIIRASIGAVHTSHFNSDLQSAGHD